MTNVRLNLVPATVGSLVAMAWFASGQSVPSEPSWLSQSQHTIVTYRDAALSTHGKLAAGAQGILLPTAASSMMSFHRDLTLSQEELGSQFEAVLYENLWDLYAR